MKITLDSKYLLIGLIVSILLCLNSCSGINSVFHGRIPDEAYSSKYFVIIELDSLFFPVDSYYEITKMQEEYQLKQKKSKIIYNLNIKPNEIWLAPFDNFNEANECFLFFHKNIDNSQIRIKIHVRKDL